MEIKRDDDYSQFLRDAILNSYRGDRSAPRRGKWHVSDLLFPRYGVLSRLHPTQPDDTAIGFFLTGEAFHRAIQKILGNRNAEIRGEALSVTGTADYFDGATLVEFKTSRKWTVPELPEEHYVEQARYYSFIFNVPRVRIAAIYPTAGRKWDGSTASTIEIRSWVVEFSPEDKEKTKQDMMTLVRDMTKAYQTGDITALPECPPWKYGTVEYDKEKKEYFKKVRCPFADICHCNSKIDDEVAYKNSHRRTRKEKVFKPRAKVSARGGLREEDKETT